MANDGGMWPMRQSDRGGLLVSSIEDAPTEPTAFERAAAKVRASAPGSVVELTGDEMDAVCGKADAVPAARSALATAGDVVHHRRLSYGSPKENFQRIADFWTIALRDKLTPGATVSLTDVAQMMRLVKEARLIETPDHFDSLVDICGYVDCQQQVL